MRIIAYSARSVIPHTARTLAAGTDLLFLDEIQAAPEALAALRYFREEMPELHVVAATYRDDFNKYSHGWLKDRIQLVFDRLPNMVGRKFKYVQVSREHRAAELADALQHLCMARVAGKVHRTAAALTRRRRCTIGRGRLETPTLKWTT